MDTLRFRHIHLDFHTSEAIPGVGKDWDKAHFQDMLRLGRVNSINIFAKCHHGWCYYPTHVPGSETHPTLKIDLLGAMIDACHEIDVKCPAYISVGLDEKAARRHSDWLRRMPDGSTSWVGWMQAGYHEFCLRSPYLDYVIAQIEEVVRNYDVDGVWLDIVGVKDCCCQTCVAEMRRQGQDPRDPKAQRALARDTYLTYARLTNAAIRAIKPHVTICHNHGHITRGDRELAEVNTHLELESLPTGGWGYDHFPLSARYVHGLGMEFLGMTGKFHTSWGEFGGFKHPNALRYEAALALANGAKICVGDQMHPYGRLDPATYKLVGSAFAEVEAREPWCHDVTSAADVGVLTMEAFVGTSSLHDAGSVARLIDPGAVRVLQEGKILYDVIDPDADFSRYAVLILPDAIPVNAALEAKLKAYLASGGRILASGASALDPRRQEFVLDFGVRYSGETPFSPEYMIPRFPLAHWDTAAFVIYCPMKDIQATTASVLADRQDPFFNRDYLHFSSHQHTPNTQVNAGPAMVRTANTVYIAFDAFRQYAEHGQNVLRDIILHGIRELLPHPTLTTSLPAQGIQSVMRQKSPERTVVHLLYAAPVRRGTKIEVIEDLVPIRDTSIALRVQRPPKKVYLAPQNQPLPFTVEDGVVRTTVSEFTCHQMVVFE